MRGVHHQLAAALVGGVAASRVTFWAWAANTAIWLLATLGIAAALIALPIRFGAGAMPVGIIAAVALLVCAVAYTGLLLLAHRQRARTRREQQSSKKAGPPPTRSFAIALRRSSLVRAGTRCGAEERSSKPSSPSTR